MRNFLILIIAIGLTGCQATNGQISLENAQLSGCIVGGAGNVSGTCTASMSANSNLVSRTIFLHR